MMQIDKRNSWVLIADALQLASERNILVEIGAYNGDDSKRLNALARKPVQQYAFEPDKRNLKRMYANNLPPTVQIIPAAVGGRDGKAQFHLSSGWDCSSSLRAPKEHLTCFPDIKFKETVEVDVVTLDKFFSNIDGIDFMWIDAQGAERDIVAGGVRILSGSRFMYLERADHELYEGQWKTPDMIHALEALGWQLEALFDHDALFFNRAFFNQSPFARNKG